MTVPTELTNIERTHLRAQIAEAPKGHVVKGPAQAPPFWRCETCGLEWSDGLHAKTESSSEDRRLNWPLET
jgi:hypothetical protein